MGSLIATVVFVAVAANPVAAMTGQEESTETPEPPTINDNDLTRLSKEKDVWFDTKQKIVVVGGSICLTEGQLEVFACPEGTKEHESVIKLKTSAFLVHVGLLRVGAIPGRPVRFHPEYEVAEGMIIDLWVFWEDESGKQQRARAQEWVRNAKTKKQLEQDWVFGGSGFWADEETGQRFYQAEGGELVCLSNFSTATMDLPIESTESNDALLFEPFTERIPNRGTEIRLVFKPRFEKKEEGAKPASLMTRVDRTAKPPRPQTNSESDN